MNEFQDVACLSGVGKGGQATVVHLDKKDTAGVWVDAKTKLTDSPTTRYTHFIGILVRPAELDKIPGAARREDGYWGS